MVERRECPTCYMTLKETPHTCPGTADVEQWPPLAHALSVLMSDISERCYCAGWLIGLEFTLWRMVSGEHENRNFGQGTVEQKEIASLRALSEACGGWMLSWDRFVPMAEWEQIDAGTWS